MLISRLFAICCTITLLGEFTDPLYALSNFIQTFYTVSILYACVSLCPNLQLAATAFEEAELMKTCGYCKLFYILDNILLPGIGIHKLNVGHTK